MTRLGFVSNAPLGLGRGLEIMRDDARSCGRIGLEIRHDRRGRAAGDAKAGEDACPRGDLREAVGVAGGVVRLADGRGEAHAVAKLADARRRARQRARPTGRIQGGHGVGEGAPHHARARLDERAGAGDDLLSAGRVARPVLDAQWKLGRTCRRAGAGAGSVGVECDHRGRLSASRGAHGAEGARAVGELLLADRVAWARADADAELDRARPRA